MPADARLQVLLLAAGAGRRMGRDKATLPWGAITLIEHIHAQFPSDIARVRIVANPTNAPAIQSLLLSAPISINPIADADMLSSVRTGIAACDPGAAPLCIHPLDVFAVTPNLVRLLHRAALAQPDKIHAPLVTTPTESRRAHPIIFPWKFVPHLDSIPPKHGLNWLLRQLAAEVQEHSWPDANLLADLDTPADYERQRPHQ